MKFLLKIEEAMDRMILNLMARLKGMTPEALSWAFHELVALPVTIKKKIKNLQSKFRIFFLKLIGYTDHYTTMVRGHLVGFLIYLRSEEFKKKDKVEMVIAPLRKFKTDPVQALTVTVLIAFFGTSSYFIFKNAEKIVVGTKALRKPASAHLDEEPLLEFRKLKYSATLPTGTPVELGLDVIILAESHEDLDLLIKKEEKILEELEKFTPVVLELPLNHENKIQIEDSIQSSLIKKLHLKGIKSVQVKQILEGRPKYFMQTEKLYSFKDTNLQLFLEDTRRNRQVWVDFTALTSNRFVVFYLQDHLIQIKDHLNTHVEPVIPRLPLEDEGRQIIKDKIKSELNDFLKKEGVEGKVLEIYIDYLIVS